MAASLGKMPTTFVRRLISAFGRSGGLVTGMILPGASAFPPFVSRTFGEIAYLEEGQVRPGGRVTLQREPLQRFGQGLRPSDEVVLEATGNTTAIVAALKPHVAKVVLPTRCRCG